MAISMKKIPFDQVFPQVKNAKEVRNRQEAISLAHKVANALEKESEELAKKQQNLTSSRFFCPAS